MKKNIALIGMPGSGKTTIGRILAKELNITFIDIDKEIEKNNNMKISDIFKNGEEYFRKLEKEELKKICNLSPYVISTGGGVIKDKENIDILKKNAIIIFIDRNVNEIEKDINTDNRPLLNTREALSKLYNERYNLYLEYSDIRLDNSSTEEDLVKLIIDSIRE